MSMKVTYRRIAIRMVKQLPVENDTEFMVTVNQYIKAMERLPRHCQLALKAAYIFAAKVPPEDRQDCFQDYYLAVHTAHPKDEALAYTVAKRSWINTLRKSNKRKAILDGGFISLSQMFTHDGQECELSQAITDPNDFTSGVESRIDAERIWQILPPTIKRIVLKKLNGQQFTINEHWKLTEYLAHNENKIRELANIS